MGFSCAQKLLLCTRCAKHLLCRAPAVAQERDVWEDFNYSPWQPTLIAIIPPNKLDRPFSHIHRNISRKDIRAVDTLLGTRCQAAEHQHEAPGKTSLTHPWQFFGLTLLARSRGIPPRPAPNPQRFPYSRTSGSWNELILYGEPACSCFKLVYPELIDLTPLIWSLD